MHSEWPCLPRSFLLVALVAILSEIISTAEFLQPIPYLYFSFNDSDVNYIEFTKYYNLEGTMNPVLDANPSMNLKLIQPFEFSNMTTKPPLINNQSLQDCTVATTSVSEFGAMVCKNNFFFIYSVDRVMATQDLNKIDVPTFVPGGTLTCQSAFIDLELALGFVTCLKSNDSAAGIEIMAVQLLDGAELQWSKLNWLLPNSSSEPSPTHIKAVVAQINKRPNTNETSLMVQTLEIVLVIGSPFGQGVDKVHPKVLYELQFAISISNTNINLVKLKNSVDVIDLADFFLNQNLVLIDLIGAPETKFYETFNSSLMLLTLNLAEPSNYASD